MDQLCFKFINKCDIHEKYTTSELIELYERDPRKIINVIKKFLKPDQLPNFFVSFQNLPDPVLSIQLLTCLLQLTIEYVKYGLDFKTTNENEFKSKYKYTFANNKDPNFYEVYTVPKLITLIKSSCICKYDYNIETESDIINYLKLQHVPNKRIEFVLNNLMNEAKKTIDNIALNKIIKTELNLLKHIHPYIIENFPIKAEYINFNKENTQFMKDNPYLIHPNMHDYMIWHLSNKNFSSHHDVHHIIHGEIIYVKINRLFNCVEHFPWRSDNVVITNETIEFITSNPYNIHRNRFPIVIKELSNIDFGKCDDIQTFVHEKLIEMSKISKNIPFNIIKLFPSNNSNVIITKENILEIAHEYLFPQSRLDLLIKILSDIDFINCDDIHLTIHNMIISVKDKLIRKNPFIKYFIIDLTNIPNIPENDWIKIFEAYINNKKIYFDNKNNIMTDNDCWVYSGEETPIYYEINFNVAMCMMCNKMKDPTHHFNIKLLGYDRVKRNKMEIKQINTGPYICTNFCSMSIKNSKHIYGQVPNQIQQRYYYNAI